MGDKSKGPNVYLKETDISQFIDNNPSVIGGCIGFTKKGRTDRTLVTNSQDFVAIYGNPEVGNYGHYMAIQFLSQGRQLYFKRIINGALYSGASAVSKDSTDTITAFTTGTSAATYTARSSVDDQVFDIFADNQGAWGNSISVKIENVLGAHKVVYSGSVYKCLVNHSASVTYTPGASATHWELTTDPTTGIPTWENSGVTYVSDPTEAFTFDIVVYETDTNNITSLVETWNVSRVKKIDGFGKQLYLETKINDYSMYIRVSDNTSSTDYNLPKANSTAVLLAGGTNGSNPTASHFAGSSTDYSGWYTFYNESDVTVNILIGGSYLSSYSASDIVTIQTAMKSVAENRKDTIAFCAVPDSEKSASSALTFRNSTQNFNTDDVALFSPYVKINDSINDQVVTIPPIGSIAAAYARTTYNGEIWDGVGGWTNGQLPNVIGLSQRYNDSEIGLLDAAQVNCIKVSPGRGIALFGQRTMQKKSSALSGINVRRMLNMVEYDLCEAYQDYIISYNNTEDTRFEVASVTDSYLSNLAARGAFQTEAGDAGYRVVCDTSNNTPAVIDAYELAITVFVKPVRSIYYVRLNVVVTSTGASFDELVSRGYQF